MFIIEDNVERNIVKLKNYIRGCTINKKYRNDKNLIAQVVDANENGFYFLTFNEWNDVNRQVVKGAKAVVVKKSSGDKICVFTQDQTRIKAEQFRKDCHQQMPFYKVKQLTSSEILCFLTNDETASIDNENSSNAKYQKILSAIAGSKRIGEIRAFNNSYDFYVGCHCFTFALCTFCKDINPNEIVDFGNFEIVGEIVDKAIELAKDIHEQIVENLNEAKSEPKQITLNDVLTEQKEVIEQKKEVVDNRFNDENALGGQKTKFKNNIEAIRLLRVLDTENRLATKEEQVILSKYVGWGGLAQAFDESNSKWAKEYVELKEILNEKEYDFAKQSTLTAFYTPKVVIQGIYKAVENFGYKNFNNIKILEPSCGIGNFLGTVPDRIKDKADITAVEIDEISGKIAKYLYQSVDVNIKGFEDTELNNNSFDIAIGNIPFGAIKLFDREYNKLNLYIHDYFFVKSLDKVKPNGIVAFITTKGTLDKTNSAVRKYLSERAELIGAIRLPNNIFKAYAGTEVTSDILFLRKRKNLVEVSDESIENQWLNLGFTENEVPVNEYYVAHPEMLLGKMAKERSMYGSENETTLHPFEDKDFGEVYKNAISLLPKNIVFEEITQPQIENKPVISKSFESIKNYSFFIDGETVYQKINGEIERVDLPSRPNDTFQRVEKMISLKEKVKSIIEMQVERCSDEELSSAQQNLARDYDAFVKKYGCLNERTNYRLFNSDVDCNLLFAIENYNDKDKVADKADIFFKRTINPYIEPTHADNCFEALSISLNAVGKLDIKKIEELTENDYDTVIAELGNAVYKNPEKIDANDKYKGWETAEEYLSGNVKRKLFIAENYSSENKDFNSNVEALKEIIPADIPASEISFMLGSSWIDTKYYQEFIAQYCKLQYWERDCVEIFKSDYNNGKYTIETKNGVGRTPKVRSIYGTTRKNAFEILEDTLNMRTITIYDTKEDETGKKYREVNKAETLLVRDKQREMKEAFKEWLFNDVDRRDYLVQKYNDMFNTDVLPKYDGSYLKFPNMTPEIQLREHQKNAIHRIITGRDTLLHHEVGTGKTFTMCAAIMKLKQYKLANKPMIVVPNSLLFQFANDFIRLYPSANILVATKDDLKRENRTKFQAKVALGDWDAVIIQESSFAKIPISKERQKKILNDEIEKIEDSIRNFDIGYRGKNRAVKELERILKNKETDLKKLLDGNKKDDVINFEKLGIDYLFVDEAHKYKNKTIFTTMTNVAGISTARSQRASDMSSKCDYINEMQNGDKGIVFATGTPISNSMTEMYIMMSYLMPNRLKQLGVSNFDEWASSFGEVTNDLELAPSGTGYRSKTRFSKFVNLPELITTYRGFADVVNVADINLNVPKANRHLIKIEPTEIVTEMQNSIVERAEEINAGGVNPEVDNMLKITTDGKKIALDARVFDSSVEDLPNTKVNNLIENVVKVYNSSMESKGTQLIFCDASTPKKADEYGNVQFNVYDDVKKKLIANNIPENEIKFIHEAETDLQKVDLFKKVNNGDIRILIGSTEKCGAGMNVQSHLKALHHLDTPYRPSDMEQREGRIIRQGNKNTEVDIYTYVVEKTFDAYSYQILENKQRFISQINKGNISNREAQDIDDRAMTYGEIKAITSGNPKIKRKMELENELNVLRVLKNKHSQSKWQIQNNFKYQYPSRLSYFENSVMNIQKDIEFLKSKNENEEFSMKVFNKVFVDKKEAGNELLKAIRYAKDNEVIGNYKGFQIAIAPRELGEDLLSAKSINIINNHKYKIENCISESGTVTKLDNKISSLDSILESTKNKYESLLQEVELAKKSLDEPFAQENTLKAYEKELTDINNELDLDKTVEVVTDIEAEELERAKMLDDLEESDSSDLDVVHSNTRTIIEDNTQRIQQEVIYPIKTNILKL